MSEPTEYQGMSCDEFAAAAAELALGVLTGRERAAALAHLDGCESCRELRRLPPEQARAVAMAGIYGMTARQVAESEGIPVGTAKTRIRYGLQKLRTALLPEDADDE